MLQIIVASVKLLIFMLFLRRLRSPFFVLLLESWC